MPSKRAYFGVELKLRSLRSINNHYRFISNRFSGRGVVIKGSYRRTPYSTTPNFFLNLMLPGAELNNIASLIVIFQTWVIKPL